MDNLNPYDDPIYGWPQTSQRETVTNRVPGGKVAENGRAPTPPVPPRQQRPGTINKTRRMSKYQAQSLVQKLKRATLATALAAFGATGALIATHIPVAATTTTSPSNTHTSTSTGSQNTNSGNNPSSSGSNQTQSGDSNSSNSNNGGFFNQGGGGYSFGNGGSIQAPNTGSSVS